MEEIQTQYKACHFSSKFQIVVYKLYIDVDLETHLSINFIKS